MSDRVLARAMLWLFDLLVIMPTGLPADVTVLLIAVLGSRGGP